MKVDFNKTFKNYRGDDLLIDGRPRLMSEVIAQCLFNGEGLRHTGDAAKDGERKLRSYRLCMRIMQSGGEITLEAEDAVLVKESVVGLTPGCYSQIVELIDG